VGDGAAAARGWRRRREEGVVVGAAAVAAAIRVCGWGWGEGVRVRASEDALPVARERTGFKEVAGRRVEAVCPTTVIVS
jgi:hypothetical protein